MSSLSAMTGFARVSGVDLGTSWQWEARSVNGRSLDLRVKVPAEFTAIERDVRAAFSDVLTRGNIQISLTVNAQDSADDVVINEALFDKLATFARKKGKPVDRGFILGIDGVVTRGTVRSDVDQAALEAALISGGSECATALKAARDSEGAALAPLFDTAVARMETLIKAAETAAATQPASVAARLQAQIDSLDISLIDPDRLAAEIAILASRADVREETDRLHAHCEQARAHLKAGSPIGRKLDFLAQEFNREINTLCAKSADIELTRIGLEMKTVVEQFREQAANVE